VEVIYWFSS